MWEHFAHQADIGIRASAASLSKAFQEAALALVAIVTEPQKIEPRQAVKVECSGESEEDLFINWLNALIYEMDVRKMLFSRFDVSIDNLSLSATIWGEKIDQDKHAPAVEPKAATYNQLSVKEENGMWTVQCVVDV